MVVSLNNEVTPPPPPVMRSLIDLGTPRMEVESPFCPPVVDVGCGPPRSYEEAVQGIEKMSFEVLSRRIVASAFGIFSWKSMRPCLKSIEVEVEEATFLMMVELGGVAAAVA
ncbi:hypothetical protein ACFE04_000454 [Oxalis oulophora]